MSLSLSWICQRDRVSLLVKFGLNKNNFFLNKIIILFKYCANVENCKSFRSFGFIYIQIFFSCKINYYYYYYYYYFGCGIIFRFFSPTPLCVSFILVFQFIVGEEEYRSYVPLFGCHFILFSSKFATYSFYFPYK